MVFLKLETRLSGDLNGYLVTINWLRPMLVPALYLSIRSQVRRRELHTKRLRMLRTIHNTLLKRDADLVEPVNLQLRLECRSYELGWLLWSFGRRSDLPQLTHNQIFVDALQQPGSFAA